MHGSLITQVEQRLNADDVDGRTRSLVLAAFAGSDAIAAASAGEVAAIPERAGTADEHSSVFLTGIDVEGFRGIGPTAGLMFEPGPGLTLVVGRNGSGKSSFAEGLEMLLTGSNLRWKDRAAAWKDGWRNVHQTETASISAGFVIEGLSEPTTVRRWWDGDNDLEESAEQVVGGDPSATSLQDLQWQAALDNHRPFLSYNELGSMLEERPSDLHDAMSAFLGLGELTAAQDVLRHARLDHEQPKKDLKPKTAELVQRLEGADDPRADSAHGLLTSRKPDLDALGVLCHTSVDGTNGVGQLAALANLTTPQGQQLDEAAQRLGSALEAAAAVAGTDAGRASRLGELLRGAHAHVDEVESDTCPVCGTAGVLDDSWRARTVAELRGLEESAALAQAAAKELDAARRAARTAIVGVPTPVVDDVDLASCAAARDLWTRWADTPADDIALVERLGSFGPVAAAVDKVREEAAKTIEEQDLGWQPHARAIANWVESSVAADASSVTAKQIKEAENWLKATIGEIRSQRFAPVAAQSQKLWTLLRHRSNVSLEQITLEGANTARRVELNVTVDGTPCTALGVMSQGELHALALSLFLPRAMMDQSPFRFIVIDDPVQAMDPARVDGLARVLQDVAQTHQVIVFTHDERLGESVQRLGIAAEHIEVTRQPGSKVSTRPVWDAVTTALDDARAVALTRDMALKARQKIVPTYCRLAVESAAAATVRRRRLGRGDEHRAVEVALSEAQNLRPLLALALFDDAGRAKDVNDTLKRDCSKDSAWALHNCNSGAHGNFDGEPKDLVKASTKLAEYLLTLP